MERLIFILACFIICTSNAKATPYIDNQVSEFIHTHLSKDNHQIRVLLTFSTAPQELDSKISLLSHLKAEGLTTERQFKVLYPWAKSKTLASLWIINGFFVSLNSEQLNEVVNMKNLEGVYWAKHPIQMHKQPHPDRSSTPLRTTYGLKKIGVPELRNSYPHLLGTGVRVGVLDTGITPEHPDLKGRLKVYKDFSPAKNPKPKDGFGHGTHVAGTIAGGNKSGTAVGVAPDVDLIVGRIFDHNGSSEREQILLAMQWMADPDGDPKTNDHAQVVNSSWSDDDPYDDRLPAHEPFCKIINSWLKMDIIPVFSAGNGGPADGSIHLPGGCPQAFSVGATEHNDRSPHFSSSGPAKWKNLELMKPEVSAPGFKINSTRANGGYEKMSGTSMAAPHVTGAFAILLQQFPQSSAAELMDAMKQGAKDVGRPGQDKLFGWGRIDIMQSIDYMTSKPTP